MDRESGENVRRQVEVGMLIGRYGGLLNAIKAKKAHSPKDSEAWLLLDTREKLVEEIIVGLKVLLKKLADGDLQGESNILNGVEEILTCEEMLSKRTDEIL
jgi:hypothetical protein